MKTISIAGKEYTLTVMEKSSKYIELSKYIEQFANLNINVNSGQHAPHKPIMLMAVMSLIESGDIWKMRYILPRNLELYLKLCG